MLIIELIIGVKRPFYCPTCREAFHDQSHLNIHQQSHKSPYDRPYACTEPACDRKYTTQQHMRLHVTLTHSANQQVGSFYLRKRLCMLEARRRLTAVLCIISVIFANKPLQSLTCFEATFPRLMSLLVLAAGYALTAAVPSLTIIQASLILIWRLMHVPVSFSQHKALYSRSLQPTGMSATVPQRMDSAKLHSRLTKPYRSTPQAFMVSTALIWDARAAPSVTKDFLRISRRSTITTSSKGTVAS